MSRVPRVFDEHIKKQDFESRWIAFYLMRTQPDELKFREIHVIPSNSNSEDVVKLSMSRLCRIEKTKKDD